MEEGERMRKDQKVEEEPRFVCQHRSEASGNDSFR